MIYVGTAAWNIPKEYRGQFPEADSILKSYAQRLSAVEINSSFYKHHQAKTYQRWAESVPEDFRFSVKLSKEFTHDGRMQIDSSMLAHFKQVVGDYQLLGEKLGCLLVQLPPSQDWQEKVGIPFFETLRECYQGPIAFEPRHVTWLHQAAKETLRKYRISRVWADPAPILNPKSEDFLKEDLLYLRLHGSPKIYQSNYQKPQLESYQAQILTAAQTVDQVWCIFDNTSYGYATPNALEISVPGTF